MINSMMFFFYRGGKYKYAETVIYFTHVFLAQGRGGVNRQESGLFGMKDTKYIK